MSITKTANVPLKGEALHIAKRLDALYLEHMKLMEKGKTLRKVISAILYYERKLNKIIPGLSGWNNLDYTYDPDTDVFYRSATYTWEGNTLVEKKRWVTNESKKRAQWYSGYTPA